MQQAGSSVACGIMSRRWVPSTLFAICGVAVAAALAAGRSTGAAVAALSVFVLLAWAHSPLMFPRSIGAAEARRRSASDGRPIVYWRPGCLYCLRLRIRLGWSARRLHWVDIWRDPAGAATVRTFNDGNETVPTVVMGDHALTNPGLDWVRSVKAAPEDGPSPGDDAPSPKDGDPQG